MPGTLHFVWTEISGMVSVNLMKGYHDKDKHSPPHADIRSFDNLGRSYKTSRHILGKVKDKHYGNELKCLGYHKNDHHKKTILKDLSTFYRTQICESEQQIELIIS